MACGLKNQNNTQQGGVHLTERTCSPYNPIIKLMVDDCLGVPIYLVSSIDAIIDEEGRTLRQLLEDIQTGTSDGTLNLLEIIEQIQNTLTTLNTIYATDTELEIARSGLAESISIVSSNLETLKKYLLAVFNLAPYNTSADYEFETYNDISYPKIVAIIKLLLRDVNTLLEGKYPDADLVASLKNLLLAIANFDEDSTFTRDEWVDLGILPAEGGKLKIIYKILDLINDLGELGDNVTNLFTIVNGNTTDTNSLNYKNSVLGQLEYIIEQIRLLLTWTKDNDFAHLETYSDGKDSIKKLAVDEYPVTSAMFATDFETLKNYINIITSNTNTNTGNTNTNKSYYLYIVPGITIGYEKLNLQWDFNDNGYIDLGDVAILATTITTNKVTDIPARFDVNGDNEVNVSDVRDLIDYILDKDYGNTAVTAPEDWGKHIYEIRPRKTQFNAGPNAQEGTEYRGPFKTFFEGTNDNFVIIEHSLIPGKVYVDTNTTQTYRYHETSSGRPTMIKVMDLEQLGVPQNNPEMLYLPINPNSTQDSELVVNNPAGVNYNNQKSYEISISEENFPVNLTAYLYPDDESQLEEGKYYIKTTPSNILRACTYKSDMLDKITILSDDNDSSLIGQYQVRYTISNVSDIIDVLLSSNNKNLSATNKALYNKLEELNVWLNEHLGTGSDKEQICRDIINVLSEALGDTGTDRTQHAIKQWADSITSTSNHYTDQDSRVVYLVNSGRVTTENLKTYMNYNPAFKEKDIELQVFNFDDLDDVVNVYDLTTIIDHLMSSTDGKKTYDLNITPISILVKYEDGQEKQIISKDALTSENSNDLNVYLRIKTENRLVRLVDAEPNEEWWRFNASSICPLIPKVTINYDKTSKDITLYTGSIITGSASMRDEEPTSGPLDGLVIEKMINFSNIYPEPTEPYVFGTWDSSVVQKHPYLEDNYSIKSGTSFILTKDEVENGTVPELGEDEYSYISDTTEFSMMSTPELTPLVIQCSNLISDFIKEMSGTTPISILLKYNFESDRDHRKHYKIIRTKYDAFDFQHITAYVTGNTNEYDHAEIYTIWKDITIIFDLAGYTDVNSTHNLIDYFDYEAVLHFTTKRNVIADKQYDFPKYGASLVFNKIDRSGLTWLRPTIITSNTIRFGYSTSEKILDLTPNNFFNIDIVGTTTIDLRPFFSLPGHEALTIQGTIYSSVDNPIINFLGTDTNGNTVTMDPNNPSIVLNKTYRFTIDNAVFTLR